MNDIRLWINNPTSRRLILVVSTSSLIVSALAAAHLLGLPGLANLLHLIAASLALWEIAGRAWRSLRNKYISIELLVTIASVGALIIGEFWEASAVTFLFIFGAYLEARTLNKTRQVLGELLDLAPVTAIVLRGARQEEVLPHQVEKGETVLLKPGMRIPVDGEVILGLSTVDESAITGEPMPEEKQPGGVVYAGTINQAGLLHIRATGVGSDTTLARIIRRVEDAQEAKAPTQRFIERFARWYTPLIIVLSLLLFLFTRNIELALTLLVISCPGALVISTPVSVVAGIGRAARSGILIKGGEYLENSGKITAIALDKTGTITKGKPRVTEVIPLPAFAESVFESSMQPSLMGPETGAEKQLEIINPRILEQIGAWNAAQARLLYWAIAAEAGSEHPLARAIVAESENIPEFLVVPAADTFDTYTGKGVRANWQGRDVLVGTTELMREKGIEIDNAVEEEMQQLRSKGKTAVLVSLDEQAVGILGISDQIRPDTRKMLKRLKESGIKKIVMLTGDDWLTARAIASEAGISEVQAELLPEDKLNAIKKLQSKGHVVAMVGDGINDAPALAVADIGIAMGAAGSGIAIETADIALMADDLQKIPEAIRLSKSTLWNIRQNTLVALGTVSLLVLGVLFGQIHMAGGMLIHEASVLVVILNGMRLLRA